MAVGASIGGLASALNSTLTGIGGSASVDDSALALGIGGTASVSETAAAPWLEREWGRVRVEIDGADVLSLVGNAEWERSSERATQYATFTIADARVAYAHASSLSAGSFPVRIYRYVGSRGGSSEELVFQGRTTAPNNADPILPTGTFRCISDSAVWDEPRACFRVGAFGGYTRGEIIDALCASVGLAVTVPAGSALVRKPVELMNVAPFAVIKRYGEIEGWYPRARVDGGLDILTTDQVWARGATFWFDESNSFTPSEDPPQDPVTRWVLIGTTIASDFSGDSVTGSGESGGESVVFGYRDGKYWETKTMIRDSGSGVSYGSFPENGQVEQIIEEWDTFAPLGTTAPAEAFQLKKRTTTRTYFKTFSYTDGLARTSQPIREMTAIEEWFSPLGPKALYAWTDGSHHYDAAQTFRRTSLTRKDWTWIASTDPDRPCELDNITTKVTSWYDYPNGGITGEWNRDGGGSETYVEDTAEAYDDGETYAFATLSSGPLMLLESETIESWTQTVLAGLRSVTQSVAYSGWKVTRGEIRGPYDAINNRQYRYAPLAVYGALGTSFAKYTQAAISGTYTKQVLNLDGSGGTTQENGDLPEIPKSDGLTPAYQQDTMTLDATDASVAYPYKAEIATVEDAESMAELEAVWRHRKRLDRCVRHTIPAPDYKWLDVWERTEESDEARSMTSWPGPVESMRVSVDVLSGFGEGTYVVLLEDPNA